jgi:hypothetical protein
MDRFPRTTEALEAQLEVKGLAGWVGAFLTDGVSPETDGVGEALCNSSADQTLLKACGAGWERLTWAAVDLGATDLERGFQVATCAGDSACVKILGPLIDDINTGLFIACTWGHVRCVEILLDLGATNLNECLKWACYWNHSNVVRLLMRNGATELAEALRFVCAGNEHGRVFKDLGDLGVTKCGCEN